MPGKLMNFDLPKGQSSIIKVIGVGGGGSNAVNHMFSQGIKGVDFVVCNTDSQALDNSPVPHKIQLGSGLTEGLGAGGDPDVGKNSALENIEQIKEILETNTQMVFVTAGMGGGTGTGGAPVIAAIAKEMGILTVGIVTIPFSNEGPKRKEQAEEGLERLRASVDSLIIICNDKLREMYGNLTLSTAFLQADNILATAARGIAEMISVHGTINVDFRDVSTVMKDSGVAIMGSGVAEGESRAVKAVELALASPLLNDNKITGARYVLLNITTGKEEPLLDEITDISDYVQQEAGNIANVIMGVNTDEDFENELSVTIIAAGFETNPDLGFAGVKQPERIVRNLTDPGQPTIVHQLGDVEQPKAQEVKAPEQPVAQEEKKDTVFPPIISSKPVIEPNVIESTPVRKVFQLKMDEEEETSMQKREVEEEIKLITREEPIVEQVKEEPTAEPTIEEPVAAVPTSEAAKTEDLEDLEEAPEAPANFWDAQSSVAAPEAAVEDEAVVEGVTEKEAETNDESFEAIANEEAAAKKQAELDAILNKFPSPPNKENSKTDELSSEASEQRDFTNLEDLEVVGKAKEIRYELDAEEPEEADMPEFRLMSDTGSDAVDNSNEIELSTDTTSSLDTVKRSLNDPVSDRGGEDSKGIPSYNNPNSMDQADRVNKLKEMSYKLRTPSGVSDLEDQPAYMRRNVNLDDIPHSSKSQVSRFTLNDTEDGEDKIELKPDNPFLHDTVD